MPYYYYERDGETYQIEADRYEQESVNSDPPQGEWRQDLVWRSGLRESNFFGWTDPNAEFRTTGSRCGPDGIGISVIENNRAGCSGDGRPPREYLLSISWEFVLDSRCETRFYKGNEVILTLDTCAPVGEDPRNKGCSDCCRELLPLLKAIEV